MNSWCCAGRMGSMNLALVIACLSLAAEGGAGLGQTAGRKVDKAAQTTGNALSRAAEKTGKALKTAADKTGGALDKAGQKTSQKLKKVTE